MSNNRLNNSRSKIIIEMGEDSDRGYSFEGMEETKMRINSPPPVEALTSVPTDRLRELYSEFDRIQQQLENNPGGILEQNDAETVLIFFTLASAILEKLCVQLMLKVFPEEEYPDDIESRRTYLASGKDYSQSERIDYLHEHMEEFNNGVKGPVKDVWNARCALVHDAHEYRRPSFNLRQKGKKAFDSIDKLRQL